MPHDALGDAAHQQAAQSAQATRPHPDEVDTVTGRRPQPFVAAVDT